jgi:O-antigen/teichoic acid export membrane protein
MLLMLAGAFSSSVLPTYSRIYRHDKENLPRFYQLSYKYLMLVGFLIGLVTMQFGGKIVELIYGSGFRGAGTPIIILSGSLFAMMGYSNGPLLNAISKQRFFAWTQTIFVLVDAILCIVLIPAWGLVGAAAANTISCLGGLILHSIVCHRQLGLSIPWAVTMKVLLAVLVTGTAIQITILHGVPWWLILSVVAPVTYILSIFLLKLIEFDELRFLASGKPRPEEGLD